MLTINLSGALGLEVMADTGVSMNGIARGVGQKCGSGVLTDRDRSTQTENTDGIG
jgi:hypothetical protein